MRKIYGIIGAFVLVALFMPACVPTAPDCTKPEIFCVGMVTDSGKITDKSFNQSTWEGLQQSKADGVIDWIQYIETTDFRDYAKNITVFTNIGYDVIVTVGYNLAADTAIAATSYPDLYFIGVDQYQDWSDDEDTTNDIPNLASLNFPEDQAGFLVGALAAMMTETNKIGAVCASDALPQIWRYGEGYRAGAAYIDSDVEVLVVYNNDVYPDISFNDPEWGATTAGSMIDDGADVIFGTGDDTGIGAIVEAAARGVYAIGADSDKYSTEPEAAPRLLSSAVKLITPGIVELIQASKDAQAGSAAFPAGNYIGQAGLAPYHDLDDIVPDGVKTRMEEIYIMVLTGELQTGVTSEKP
jgi:basic membrane protein A